MTNLPDKPTPPEFPKTKMLKPRIATRRPAAPPPRPTVNISRKQIILIGAGVVLLLVVIVGYHPVMRMLQVRTLDNPAASGEARQAAAERLATAYAADALGIFKARLGSADQGQREAVAYGLELLARKSDPRALNELATEFAPFLKPESDNAAKVLYLTTLTHILQKADAKENNALPGTVAPLLLPCAGDVKESAEVRLAALKGLNLLPVTGVCTLLLKIAANEKGPPRAAALEGIAPTALPENCADLLTLVAGSDKELAGVCKKAFAGVRDQADSAQLLDLVTSPSEDVRREIVLALGKRKSDPKAAQAITKALKDQAADIRLLAVKAVPTTGLSGSSKQLADLVRDPDEAVRVANAETLGQLRDDDSRLVVLEAFGENLTGKTLEAYSKALSRRSQGKDLNAIGMVMKLLDTNPQAKQALVYLTMAGYREREQQRAGWSVAKWKEWYANITQREKYKAEILEKMADAKKRGQTDDKSIYGELYKVVKHAIELIGKYKEMCQPDDPEDADFFASREHDYATIRYLFSKSQTLDLTK